MADPRGPKITSHKETRKKNFKRYGWRKLNLPDMVLSYEIVENGTGKPVGLGFDIPFPTIAEEVADALNEAFYQGYKLMVETLHEVTKGVIDV